MENRFEITEDIMRNARSYLPLQTKEYLVRACAPGCVKRIFDFRYKKLEDGGYEAEYLTENDDLPTTMPMYGEDTSYKSSVVLGTVMHFYLGVDIGGVVNLDDETYDMYAGSHILNQIERFKANPDFKSKAFDMLADIRDFEKRLNCAVYSLLQMKNDVGGRMLNALGAMMSQESLENVIRSVNDAQQEMKQEQDKQDAFIENLEAGETE